MKERLKEVYKKGIEALLSKEDLTIEELNFLDKKIKEQEIEEKNKKSKKELSELIVNTLI